ncbi:Glycerol-3-phosphate dehydrogenase [hydrothermal vent metagenome]|uniref:Glycerol-3-phosphate dehydrogenase n=1 Tax=hydrothermal vent metagenome TaxID=652676 RepID=A0A3B1D6G7_9ZZZZ
MKPTNEHPVLILGAGINGAAVARELLLNEVPVVVVDLDDMASGATARSSRLIHGGLRYLEYADFRLVRESLHERTRLHQLAPQFVKPLQLYIPVTSRLSGILQSTFRFLGLASFAEKFATSKGRGKWLVQVGLWLYDRMVTDSAFSNSRTIALGNNASLQVNSSKYRWLCSYWDAQILYPERFVVSMFHDARQLAKEKKVSFQLFTYHNINRKDNSFELSPVNQQLSKKNEHETITPALVINASGAWGDMTLEGIDISHAPLLGGTKGSHCIISHEGLRKEIGDAGIYAEAPDGRPVFLLPFAGKTVLVGTTDIPFSDRPEKAIATEEELLYLLKHAQNLFPQVNLSRDDIIMHYSGVRPLPAAPKGKTAAISRGHSINMVEIKGLPVMTLIGGKLTTCRIFAEDVVQSLKEKLDLTEINNSQNRPFPGANNYPSTLKAIEEEWKQLSQNYQIDIHSIAAMWELCGTDVRIYLQENYAMLNVMIFETALPRSFVFWMIEREWVTTLDDLVERRLMLLFQNRLARQTLIELAESLVDAGKLKAKDIPETVQKTIDNLFKTYGKITTELRNMS